MINQGIQRAELHRKIWAIADEVRGAVDGWDFKAYILGILFYRFISTDFINRVKELDDSVDYQDLDDAKINDHIKEVLIGEKGFLILPSQLFDNVLKNCEKNENLNTDLDKIFKDIEKSAMSKASENDIKGLFSDIDLNSPKLGNSVNEKNKKLISILKGIASIEFDDFKSNSIDAFGDAYEFIISKYASNAGKSGGEFFTPQSVSKLLAKIVSLNNNITSVYDPACGSGSLLLQVIKNTENNKIEFYGQEINITNFNLARMNMFLHGVGYERFDIKFGDTLINDLHKGKKFDAIVSNPPYSIKWEGSDNINLINDERYSPAGKLAPKNYADFAFIMHSLHHLNGVGAIVCFPGILYRRGAELAIRKYLIDNNFISAIISLSDNLFFGTSIATCILVLDTKKSDKNVLFIDGSNEFIKDTNNNLLSDENINNLLKLYENRSDKDDLTKLISNDEIANNDYNLSVSSYIQKSSDDEVIDIKELNKEINKSVDTITKLRKDIDEIIKGIEI